MEIMKLATWADVRKHGVTIGCEARSDIAVHGKTAPPHTDVCGAWIGEEMEHDLGVTNVCKSTNAGEMRNLRLKRPCRERNCG